MEKMGTFDEMIHITLRCVVHIHGHWNKMVPFMKPFILANLNNDAKFCKCTYWSINDTRSHSLPCQVNNHYINNENLVLSGHVEINS